MEKHGKIGKKEANNLESSITNQIAGIEDTLSKIKQVEELKALSQEMFGNTKKELLGGVSEIAELTTVIQKKVSAQLKKMTQDGSVRVLDQAQERFESLRATAESTETGINPLGGIDEGPLQEQMDASLEKAAVDEIKKAVLGANMGTNALTKLEKSLEPFLKGENWIERR